MKASWVLALGAGLLLTGRLPTSPSQKAKSPASFRQWGSHLTRSPSDPLSILPFKA